jgi:hypothetical protein
MERLFWIVLLTMTSLVAGGANKVSSTQEEAETPTIAPFEDYNQCGGVIPLNSLHTSTLSYDGQGLVPPYEFCVWTFLLRGDVDSLRMQVSPSITYTDGYALIAYFWGGKDLTSYRLTADDTDSTFEPPPAFLAFTSWGNTTTSIRIFLTPAGKFTKQLKWLAYHFDKAEGKFSYPEEGDYRSNDRVSVVLPPRIADRSRVKGIKLDFNTEFEHDVVAVYSLYYYWNSLNYKCLGKFSGEDEAYFETRYDFPIIILFTSDHKINDKGFTVEWGSFASKQA